MENLKVLTSLVAELSSLLENPNPHSFEWHMELSELTAKINDVRLLSLIRIESAEKPSEENGASDICLFQPAWRPMCRDKTAEPHNYCEVHIKSKCYACGQQATHECSQTIGAFICGQFCCNQHRCHEAHHGDRPWRLP